ncbi:MAG: MMPL family transporter [Deltaproteobacteria bacterium]|nr:MMPL family transporter [Deltaproteobacteria bacterium]
MVKKLSIWLIDHRVMMIVAMLVVTALFAWEMVHLRVETQFEDLLPENHPYVKTHKKYEEQLGAPYKVLLMLKVKGGDIYNQETLKKAQKITDDLDLIPGVNHNQIYSIASRKIKKTRVTADGIITENFMDVVPSTAEEMEEFKKTVRRTGSVYRVWVSRDETSLLFSASFIPRLVDPKVLFKNIQDLKDEVTDSNHELFVAGEPMLSGWIFSYQSETFWIFGITFFTLIVLLYLYFRNLVGMIVPTLAMMIGAIWGLGFAGFLGYNLEPLTLVIPLLIAARALCHSVQITERYFECYVESRDVRKAAVDCSSSMLAPGILGITTDALGILLISVAPIPIMEKLAYVCSFWAITIVFNGIIFTPLMLSFFKAPGNVEDIVNPKKGLIHHALAPLARLGFGKAGWGVFITAIILFVIGGWITTKIQIGDVNPGTPILWPDSEYNVAIDQINKNFPGTEELYVIFEGQDKNSIEDTNFLNVLESFQRHMEQNPRVATTLSVQDFLPRIQRSIYGGYFKWQVFPVEQRGVTQLFYLLVAKSAPEDYDLYFSRERSSANVIVWFKDHMGDTIRDALSWAKRFGEESKDLLGENNVTMELASGTIGMLAAINETVKESQFLNILLVTTAIFLLCSLTYRSIVAALILMIPLNLANLVTLSIMKFMGIGLNINTLPIISVGVGVGIDYGVYLLSRLCEEYKAMGGYSYDTAAKAVRSTGKAIFFTTAAMIAGVIFWYFLSSMRFQAEMGLLLGIIMFINMIGALLLIPALVYVFKPKFLGRA